MVRLRIMNLNRQPGLFKFGMRPVTKTLPSAPEWMRIRECPTISDQTESGGGFEVAWSFTGERQGDEVFFAFCYPYSYSECQEDLANLDRLYRWPTPPPGEPWQAPPAPTNGKGVAEASAAEDFIRFGSDSLGRLFYHRELLCRSPDGRRMDLLTITDCAGLGLEEEAKVEGQEDLAMPEARHPCLAPNMFPLELTQEEPHAPVFKDKQVVFISARVHPGETPASFVMNGVLKLLFDSSDTRAAALRRHFVFKIVPILNPDGVARGHYRMDQWGRNLNRYYTDPDASEQPTIHSAKAAAVRYGQEGRLALYMDLHAHATKRGCFIYGNSLDLLQEQVDNQLYALLLTVNSAHFDYDGCVFSKKHMQRVDAGDGLSAEGSGRVAVHMDTGVVHSYTLECNYNTGRIVNHVPEAKATTIISNTASTDHGQGRGTSQAAQAATLEKSGRSPSPERLVAGGPPKYAPDHWEEVGRAVLVSLLDLQGLNPWSRLSNSKYRTLDRARQTVMTEVRLSSALTSCAALSASLICMASMCRDALCICPSCWHHFTFTCC